MASVQVCWVSVLLLLLTTVPGVCGEDSALIALVVTAAVAFVFLAVVIAMIVVGFTWNNWYPAMQRAKGRVKMPRSYWKKKEEAKLRLLNGSRSRQTSLGPASENGLPNGIASARVQDTDTGVKQASWVQGWNNTNPADDGAYEEMALAMDLGEEETEFRIETSLVDNEALNLGPFKDTDPLRSGSTPAATTSEQGASITLGDDDAAYATVDMSRKSSRKTPITDGRLSMAPPPSEQATSFSTQDPSLVAL